MTPDTSIIGPVSERVPGLDPCEVVYKVDRLTRSLSEFARMVEVFDARRVSFVAPHNWEHCGPKSAKPCRGKPFDLWNELELESQKGNPGLEVFNFPVQAILIQRAGYSCRYSRWAALHG
jgi:hypothetical protein